LARLAGEQVGRREIWSGETSHLAGSNDNTDLAQSFNGSCVVKLTFPAILTGKYSSSFCYLTLAIATRVALTATFFINYRRLTAFRAQVAYFEQGLLLCSDILLHSRKGCFATVAEAISAFRYFVFAVFTIQRVLQVFCQELRHAVGQ
jgi:hypothetical protein